MYYVYKLHNFLLILVLFSKNNLYLIANCSTLGFLKALDPRCRSFPESSKQCKVDKRLQPFLICSWIWLNPWSWPEISMAPWVACLTNFLLLSCSGINEAFETDTNVLVMAITDNKWFVVVEWDNSQCPKAVKIGGKQMDYQ